MEDTKTAFFQVPTFSGLTSALGTPWDIILQYLSGENNGGFLCSGSIHDKQIMNLNSSSGGCLQLYSHECLNVGQYC